jgi:hypothetical protein
MFPTNETGERMARENGHAQAILLAEDKGDTAKREVENTEDHGAPQIEEEDHHLGGQQD